MSRTAIGLGLAGVLLFLLGCREAGTAPTVPVTGTVTYNNRPIEGVNVLFTPASGRPASGTTDAAGRFTLSTFDRDDGAVAGTHTVTIAPGSGSGPPPMPGTPEAEQARSTPSPFPQRYSDPEQSGFTATVERGGENDFSFDMVD